MKQLALLFLFYVFVLTGCAPKQSQSATGTVMTVSGVKPAESMGTTLAHEHVLVDFIGADQVSKNRYNPDEVFTRVLPYLQ